MAKLDIEIKASVKDCTLLFSLSEWENIYCVLENSTTGEVSEVMQCEKNMAFTVDSDGVYVFHALKYALGHISNGEFIVGNREYDAEAFIDYTRSNTVLSTEVTIFCACKLKKCLIDLQMQVFKESLKNCGKRCSKLEDLKSQRDFLFIANWLIEKFVEEDKMDRALDVYEGIRTCGSLCGNLLKETNNCGCNG